MVKLIIHKYKNYGKKTVASLQGKQQELAFLTVAYEHTIENVKICTYTSHHSRLH